jgi:ATP-dependent helicase/nuclease subunit A
VLVRRRNAFVEDLVRALKRLDVPVAGVDRMVLSEQLAVMDLVALGRFLLLPEDDLTLATVLRGPLIDVSEEQLFDLAHGRDGSLWSALRRCLDGSREPALPALAAAAAVLSDLLARVDYAPPYELYARILGPDRGREKLLARLGPEAADPIEEFLNLALAYEQDHRAWRQGIAGADCLLAGHPAGAASQTRAALAGRGRRASPLASQAGL